MNKNQINVSRILISLSLSIIIGISPVFAAENFQYKDNGSKNKGLELKGEVKIDSYSRKVSLSLRNTDIKQVLKLLSDKAGLNAVIHENVKGLVSLDLVNVTLNKAFEYVMTMNGLSYLKDGNTLIIAPKGTSDTLGMSRRKIKPINVKYIDALSVSRFLNANIFSLNRPDLSSAPIVVTNPRTNQIYVFGNNEDIAIAEKTVEMLDVKPIIKTFNISYSNPTLVAGNICNMVFNTNFYTQGNSNGANGSGSSNGLGSTNNSNNSMNSGNSNGSNGANGANGSINASGSNNSNMLTVAPGQSNGFNLICGQSSSQMTSSATSMTNGSSIIAGQNSNNQTAMGGSLLQEQMASVNPSGINQNTEKANNPLSGAGSFAGITSNLASLDVLGYAVFANDEVSQINIMGTEQQIKLADELIKKLDKRPLQAYFDISILEVNESNNKNFDGGLTIVNKYMDNINLTASGLAYSSTTKAGTTLSSLLATTKGKILANPRMIVASNTEATFNVKEQEGGPVSISVTPGSLGQNPIVTTSIGSPVDTGLSMTLKPIIKPNGQISLTISPSYTTTKPEKIVGTGTSRVTQTLTAKRDFTLSDVILKDGETFVLGGLINEKESKSRNKPSIFGAIPFVGGFFGSSENNKQRSELIFIITPHILKDPDNIPAPEEAI